MEYRNNKRISLLTMFCRIRLFKNPVHGSAPEVIGVSSSSERYRKSASNQSTLYQWPSRSSGCGAHRIGSSATCCIINLEHWRFRSRASFGSFINYYLCCFRIIFLCYHRLANNAPWPNKCIIQSSVIVGIR